MVFHRCAEGWLSTWYHSAVRKPLVIRGARQVGKTYLVREFCRSQDLDLVEINLEEQKVSEFEQESFDINRCINEILALCGKKLNRKTIIFVDEIQDSAKAYSRLRYFKEKRPEIPLIAAGSLLELHLRDTPQKIPVGRVEYLYLGPLTFSEFLQASGHDVMAEELTKIGSVDLSKGISVSLHDRLVRHLMDYLFVGGMPEAVFQFVAHNGSYVVARQIQNQILQAYREDIGRYAEGKTAEVIRDVLDRIAFEIGKKVLFSRLSPAKSSYVKSAVDILENVFLLQKVYHSHATGIPLRQSEDPSTFKTYFLDVGLYNCLLDIQWQDIAGLDYDHLISKGAMAEQFIAQHLYLGPGRDLKPRLHYWLRDKTSENAEVDFVIARHNKIIPVEVKSGKPGRIKSLLRFMAEKSGVTHTAWRCDLAHRASLNEEVTFASPLGGTPQRITFHLQNWPLYAAEFMASL